MLSCASGPELLLLLFSLSWSTLHLHQQNPKKQPWLPTTWRRWPKPGTRNSEDQVQARSGSFGCRWIPKGIQSCWFEAVILAQCSGLPLIERTRSKAQYYTAFSCISNCANRIFIGTTNQAISNSGLTKTPYKNPAVNAPRAPAKSEIPATNAKIASEDSPRISDATGKESEIVAAEENEEMAWRHYKRTVNLWFLCQSTYQILLSWGNSVEGILWRTLLSGWNSATTIWKFLWNLLTYSSPTPGNAQKDVGDDKGGNGSKVADKVDLKKNVLSLEDQGRASKRLAGSMQPHCCALDRGKAELPP